MEAKNNLSKNNWLFLILSIVLAALAAWLSSVYLESKENELRQQFEGEMQRTVPVVVAKSNVEPGDVISGENMVVRDIPQEFVPDGAIHPSSFKSIAGKRLLHPVSPGKAVLATYIEDDKVEQFSDLLQNGERAITISVDQFNSTAGMLEVGDKIDLFLLTEKSVEPTEDTNSKEKQLYLLLENIQVLATGKRIEKVRNDAFENGYDTQEYNTITVGVSQRDAGRIRLAEEDGNFVAFLRNRKDSQTVKYGVLTSRDIYSKSTKKFRQIEYILGGSSKNGIATTSNTFIDEKIYSKKIEKLESM